MIRDNKQSVSGNALVHLAIACHGRPSVIRDNKQSVSGNALVHLAIACHGRPSVIRDNKQSVSGNAIVHLPIALSWQALGGKRQQAVSEWQCHSPLAYCPVMAGPL